MAKELRFSTVLKEIPVYLTGKDGIEKKYTVKELTGTQRATYNESFDVKIEMDENGKAKAVAGSGFKTTTFGFAKTPLSSKTLMVLIKRSGLSGCQGPGSCFG